jgi:hypothetical protein
LHESFGSIVAQVVEVSLLNGAPRVHRVVCAVDCGTVINPGMVAQQMEGSVIFALSAALHGRIDIEEGVVRQKNFPQYGWWAWRNRRWWRPTLFPVKERQEERVSRVFRHWRPHWQTRCFHSRESACAHCLW